MDWLNQDGYDEVSTLRQELEQRNQELERLRSSNHQQHNRTTQQTNLLRGQLEDGKVPDADDMMNNWDWNKIAGVDSPKQKETGKVSEEVKGEDGLVFKSKKQLDDYIDRKWQKKEQQKVQHIQQAQQTQAILVEKFVKENPELIDHQPMVDRLWSQSVALNPNIPAEQRYQGVIAEAKATLTEYNLLKPANGQQQQRQVDMGNPYLGQTPILRDVGNRMPERVEYNQDSHRQELENRRKSIASKMFL